MGYGLCPVDVVGNYMDYFLWTHWVLGKFIGKFYWNVKEVCHGTLYYKKIVFRFIILFFIYSFFGTGNLSVICGLSILQFSNH